MSTDASQSWSPWFDWRMGLFRSFITLLFGAGVSFGIISHLERERRVADFKWQAEFKLRSEALASFQRYSSEYSAHEYDAVKRVFLREAPTEEDIVNSDSPDDDFRLATLEFENAKDDFETARKKYQGEAYDNLQSARRELKVFFELESLAEGSDENEFGKLSDLLDKYRSVRHQTFKLYRALRDGSPVGECFRDDDGEIWYPDGVDETPIEGSRYLQVDHDGRKVFLWEVFSDTSVDIGNYREFGYLRRQTKDLTEKIVREGFRLIRKSGPE